MGRSLSILLLAALVLGVGVGRVWGALSAQQSERLARASAFKDCSTRLPATIRALCADAQGKLADPGEAWESTDVVGKGRLARHRLIWAVTDAAYYVVHFETGGRGHAYRVAVFSTESGQQPRQLLRAYSKRLARYTDFLQSLAAGELKEGK